MFPSKVFTTKWATMVPSFLGLGSVRSINGVAEMKNLNINIKSNNRKLCQQRAKQSFIKHFNVLPVIGHFYTLPHHIRRQSPLLFENFHEIPPPLQNLSNIEKNYILTNVTCGALGIETDWAEKVLDSAS